MASFKLSYCIGNSSNISCLEIEKQALLSFKKSLEDPANLLSSWKAKVNCCKWKGVICSNLTGHVLGLHLNGHGFLQGKINPSLINLKYLRYLDLSQNDFAETIPSFIGSFKSLEYLDLSHSGFYGIIPHNLGNLSNLRTLILEDTERCVVDSLEWLTGLSKLEHLNMNGVNLSKAANWEQVINKLPCLVQLHFKSCHLNYTSPLDYVNFTSLAILDLSENDFESFAIPGWIFRLEKLTFLDLNENSFEGPIPAISNTTKLQLIDLSRNNINSTIPDWFYVCQDLDYISLSLNYQIHGSISKSIANLTSLKTLDLSTNDLSGKIPREISNLCKLQTLDLSENKFVGEISDSFGNMNLEFPKFEENQLSGHLTNQFGEFKSLLSLELSRNSLSGVIPDNIGNLSSLEYLFLGNNQLIGNIPESVGQLFNISRLVIEDNKLEGVVTENHFANLSKLTDLSASRNHLTLKVSQNWNPPFKLQSLQLESWNLGSGTQIPSWLETQNVGELDLSSTGISGNVPSWLWEISFLGLSHNQLRGKIPDISSPNVLYLRSNQFSGSLPRVEDTVTELDLSNNRFSRGISHFLCNTTRMIYTMEILDLEGNQLTGELPDCWMKWPSLKMLNLGNNMLSGNIPNSIGLLVDLLSLNLYNNKFSGQIPLSMQKCTQLFKIDFSGNDFDGNMPTWMVTNLGDLTILILRSNKLSGEIASDICHLKSLQILDISDNMVSGIIPRCVNNFTAMRTKRSLVDRYGMRKLEYTDYSGVFLESASLVTKGRQLLYDTILPLVTNIDLSQNNLSGDIPKELTSLVELRSLNVSGNHLTGLIPDNIGNMKQLESLDFSRNSLFGEIPSSFASMSSLNYLNLSYNNLTGRIPESTQLRGFSESSFMGNNLCGPQLKISCSIDGNPTAPTHKEDQDQEDDKSEIEWFYVFLFSGYAVGLSAFLTTFILKKSWRAAYYELLENMWDKIYVYFYIRWTRLNRALGRNL
ncbi:hypothetical protein DH2020_027979 [Rehmannia glutinosa]|uniref:Uncharacterized protein n=1 Tax=Rehmannia glutinosa TaxID=99300 RepID=A0ABR0VUI9_REHGL